MSGLLLDEPLLCYQPALVRRLGLAEAIVAQQICALETAEHDGQRWVAMTYDGWAARIGITAKAARTALDHLRDLGVVVAISSPIEGRDRTLWWRVEHGVLDAEL